MMKSLLKQCDRVNDSRAKWVLAFIAVFLFQTSPAFTQAVSPFSPTNIFAPISTPAVGSSISSSRACDSSQRPTKTFC